MPNQFCLQQQLVVTKYRMCCTLC